MALMQISDDDLQAWSDIGEGAFGLVYKATHKDLEMDVAIKLLRRDEGLMLQKEAEKMREGGFQYVVRVLGMYKGLPPDWLGPAQHGLVMEFVERGSVGSLLRRLGGPPPWPLAFRLCHQVALGMNYLHRLSPALLHLDLKPSNVLLDDGLSVKLTDFGLSRSVLTVSTVGKGNAGGTLCYMPPEAFSLPYKPSPASDSYSYAILLWSVLTGQEPYSGAPPCTIRFNVPKRHRPRLDLLDGVEDLGEITGLMVKLWDHSPENRPTFRDCLPVTKKVFKLHESGINDAVHQVKTLLDSKGPANLEQEESASSTQPYGGTGVAAPTGEAVSAGPSSVKTPAQTMVRSAVGQGASSAAGTGDTGGRASDSSFTPTEEKHFVIKYQVELIDRVKMVRPILDRLLQREAITPEKYSSIAVKPTPYEKMRALYHDVIIPGDRKIKDDLCEILDELEVPLMRDLRGK